MDSSPESVNEEESLKKAYQKYEARQLEKEQHDFIPSNDSTGYKKLSFDSDLYGTHFNESTSIESQLYWNDGLHGVEGYINNFEVSVDSKALSLSHNESRFDVIQELVFPHEGGVSNHPNDRGGLTNKGITKETFNSYAEIDLGIMPAKQNLTNEQASIIYKKRFWSPLKADEINSFSLSYALYDFHINAPGQAVKILQKSINSLGGNLIVDNKMGVKTITAINNISPQKLFNEYKKNRITYYIQRVANNPEQGVFLKGWLNHVNNIKFES